MTSSRHVLFLNSQSQHRIRARAPGSSQFASVQPSSQPVQTCCVCACVLCRVSLQRVSDFPCNNCNFLGLWLNLHWWCVVVLVLLCGFVLLYGLLVIFCQFFSGGDAPARADWTTALVLLLLYLFSFHLLFFVLFFCRVVPAWICAVLCWEVEVFSFFFLNS